MLAIAKDFGAAYTASDGTIGTPYILAQGSGLRSFPLSLDPVSQTRASGTYAAATAQLLDGVTSAPVSGTKLAERISAGPNTGATVSCGTCTTDAAGHVSFSYLGGSGKGTDTLQAWIDVDANGSPSAGEPQTTAAIVWTAAAGNKAYVALGDSFSSGEGAPPFEPGTDVPTDRCHRGLESYPHLLARLRSLTLTADRACSGAVIAQVIGEGQYADEPSAQITALTHETSLVTITVGGNDINFGDVLFDCLVRVTNCKTKDSKMVDTQLSRLQANLPEVYRRIRAATSPTTRILVAGYPQIFPDPDSVNVGSCSDVRLTPLEKINGGEMTWLRANTVRLDDVIKKAAASVPGVTYVDPLGSRSTFPGHEVCTGRSWFNGVVDPSGPLKVWSFHPNPLGQRAYAQLFAAYL
ncbi:SGNH/GDSL hydrolase family protein [Pseudarthrobacter sp. So.54]